MQHFSNLRGGLTFCAITTFLMGAGSQVVAQNERSNQNPSGQPAPVEQKAGGPDKGGYQDQAGHPDGAPHHVGFGLQFETQPGSGRGLEIATVDPNSPAAQAGLQAHDRLISIDGRPFAHRRHAKAYLTAQTGRPVPLVIERNGRQLLLQFIPGQPEGDSGWLGILLYGENEMPNGPNAPAMQPSAADGNQNNQSAAGAEALRALRIAGKMRRAKEGLAWRRFIPEAQRPAPAYSPEIS